MVSRRAEGVEGVVRDLGHEGDAVVATDRGVLFVTGALPGERVRVVPGERRRGVRRGKLVRVLSESADRVRPPCGHAAECGGCPLMIWRPEAARRHKAALLQRALAEDAPQVEWLASERSLGYRQRARLGWVHERGRTHLGYRAARSHRVVPIDRCPVLEPALEQALGACRRLMAAELRGSGQLRIARVASGDSAVWLCADTAQPEAAYRAAERLAEEPGIGQVALQVGEAAAALWGDRELVVPAQDARAHGEAARFAQANSSVNGQLVRLVRELAEPAGRRVLELYAGDGNLTLALAADAEALTAVEAQPGAAEACRANLGARGLAHATVVQAPVEHWPLRGRFDVVVLDPPRRGAREVMQRIADLGPARVVYVSCDMPTLGRDLGLLRARGYRPARAYALDMFPHTAHVEAVVRLDKA